MKIPSEATAREAFFWETVQACFASRETRAGFYRGLRSYFMFGASEGNTCSFNKIRPHIDLVTSYLFAAETTKFSVQLDEDASRHDITKLRPLSRRLNNEWHRSNSDLVFSQALTWSLVHGSTFIKLIPKKGAGVVPYLVQPGQMGVYREDKGYLDRQEAIAMRYTISKSQLRRELELINHPKRAQLLAQVTTGKSEDSPLSSLVQRVVLSQSTPSLIGNVNWQSGADFYRPEIGADMAEMVELWVWDDDLNDYRTITMGEPGVCVFDRPNIFVPPVKNEKGDIIKVYGEHPFVQICPNPLSDYFWGESEVALLTALQDKREKRTRQIDELLDKQARPPKAGLGMVGIPEESILALSMADGFGQFADPMSKIQEFKPDIPSDLFGRVKQLDEEFLEASGISNIMQGKGETGVRSKGQTSELARLGAARIKKRALIIEDALEKVASLMMLCIKIYDADSMKDENGQPFIADQFTQDFSVKVDAHSNSPIFVEDQRQFAFQLHERNVITREALLEITQPPMQQQLIQDLSKIEKAESDEKAREAQMEQQKQGLKAVK